MLACPICEASEETLSVSMERHVNECLDSSFETLEPQGFYCALCGLDLSKIPESSRAVHMNKCLDDEVGAVSILTTSPLDNVRECPLCNHVWSKGLRKRVAHLKECGKSRNVSLARLLLIANGSKPRPVSLDDYFAKIPKPPPVIMAEPEPKPKKQVFTYIIDDDDDFMPQKVKVEFKHEPKKSGKKDKNDAALQLALGLSASTNDQEAKKTAKLMEFGGYVFQQPNQTKKALIPVNLMTADEALVDTQKRVVDLLASPAKAEPIFSFRSQRTCLRDSDSDSDIVLIESSSKSLWDLAQTSDRPPILPILSDLDPRSVQPIKPLDVEKKMAELEREHKALIQKEENRVNVQISELKRKYSKWVDQQEVILSSKKKELMALIPKALPESSIIKGTNPNPSFSLKSKSLPESSIKDSNTNPSASSKENSKETTMMPDYASMSLMNLRVVLDNPSILLMKLDSR